MQQLLLLISLFIIILIGFIAGKKKLLDESTASHFNKYIFYIAIPASIILSITEINRNELKELQKFILITFAIQIFLISVIFIILKLTKLNYEKKFMMLYNCIEGNNIYFGLPILLTLFGESHYKLGMLYAIVVITIPELLMYFIIQINGNYPKQNFVKNQLVSFFKTPLLIATIIGTIIFILKIQLPSLLVTPMEVLAKTITGLGLISLGINFAYKFSYNSSYLKLNLLSSIIKLILIPGFVLFIVTVVFPLNKIGVETSVIQAAMPSAVFSIVLADMYKLDKKLAASNILISSILFMFTSVFWVWVLNHIY